MNRLTSLIHDAWLRASIMPRRARAINLALTTSTAYSAVVISNWGSSNNNSTSNHSTFNSPPGPTINPFRNNGNKGSTYDNANGIALNIQGTGGTNAFNTASTFTKPGRCSTDFYPSTSDISFNNAGTGGTHTRDFNFAAGVPEPRGACIAPALAAIVGVGRCLSRRGAPRSPAGFLRAPRSFMAAIALALFLNALTTYAATYSVINNGVWNNPTTWTPTGGPPGALDDARVGAGPPGVTPATVTLGVNQTVNSVTLGDASINFLGSTLTSNVLNVIGDTTLNRQGGGFVTNFANVSVGGTLTLEGADSVARYISIGGPSVLTLNKAFTLIEGVQASGGLLHVNQNLTAPMIFMSNSDTVVNLNGATLTAGRLVLGQSNSGPNKLAGGNVQLASIDVDAGSTFAIDAADNLTQSLFVDGEGSTLSINRNVTLSETAQVVNVGTLIVNNCNVDVSQTASVFGGTLVLNNSTFTASSTTIGGSASPPGALIGRGTVGGNVTNAGRVAPGNSPGILTINGNYTQTADGVLEIEVGGKTLAPDVLHDQLQVTGTATLAGRLDLPLVEVPGHPIYTPHIGDDIVVLTAAGGVTGTFNSAFLPNLPAGVAHEIQYNSNDVTLRFVAPEPIQFVSTAATAQWSNNATWEANGMAAVPESPNIINIENLAGVPQRVDVTSSNQSSHQLTVGDDDTTIAVRVEGVNLSVATGTVIKDNGAIELSNSGTLVSQTVDVQGGGLLAGNGTVKANTLVVSSGTLRPGFSVGHIDVDGAYQQDANGTLLVDIESASSFDTVDVTGSATLGGTLEIDASNLTTVTPGTLFPIVTAGSITGEFDTVESSGNNNVYFLATTIGATAYAESLDRGDMNGDAVIDNQDFDLFAFGLMNRSTSKYFAKCGCEIFPQQAGDFSGNGRLDFDDIAGFQSQVGGLGLSSDGLSAAIEHYLSPVPEPNSAMLAILGGMFAGTACGGRRRREPGMRLLTVGPLVAAEELKP